jgi:hypothetical protein
MIFANRLGRQLRPFTIRNTSLRALQGNVLDNSQDIFRRGEAFNGAPLLCDDSKPVHNQNACRTFTQPLSPQVAAPFQKTFTPFRDDFASPNQQQICVPFGKLLFEFGKGSAGFPARKAMTVMQENQNRRHMVLPLWFNDLAVCASKR